MARVYGNLRGRGRGRGKDPIVTMPLQPGAPNKGGTVIKPPKAPGRGRQGNGGTQAPARPGQGAGQGKGQGKPGVGLGGGGMTGPGGRQLAARVSSGAITQEQADRTMKQRQTFSKALGPNWRDKLSVGGKSFADVNAGLKKNPDSPKLAALRKKLVANRSSLLESAKSKGKGAEGDEDKKKKEGE